MNPLNANKPHLIITVGIPGSGKSYFAKHFSDTFKAPIISQQQVMPLVFSKTEFSKTEKTIVNKVILHFLKESLKTQRTIVFDGDTFSRSSRNLIAKIAKAAGYEPLFVWVQTDLITSKNRFIKATPKESHTATHFNSMVKCFSPLHYSEKAIVISGKHTYATQLKIILKHLAKQSDVTKPTQTKPTLMRNLQIR